MYVYNSSGAFLFLRSVRARGLSGEYRRGHSLPGRIYIYVSIYIYTCIDPYI